MRRAAAVLVSSEEVGDIFRGASAYDVHVWSTPSTRHSLSDIRNLPIDTPGGGHVRLSDVATVRVRPTPNVVHRQDTLAPDRHRRQRRATAASARSSATSATGSTDVTFPTGYHAELLGEAVEQEGA